eukprot:365281-Chlamydomonas_euryale.AAC.6
MHVELPSLSLPLLFSSLTFIAPGWPASAAGPGHSRASRGPTMISRFLCHALPLSLSPGLVAGAGAALH